MRTVPPRKLICLLALFGCGVLMAAVPLARAQEPAWPDSVTAGVVPLVFDGTGTSAWGPISDAPDSLGARPRTPSLSLWEYPVAGLWWLVKLPFSILNYGLKAVVPWFGDVPFHDEIARLLSKLPDFGLRVQAEWTPSSGFRYRLQFYEHRLFENRLWLQYTHTGGGRGDLQNAAGARILLREKTWLDFVGNYYREGAGRYYGPGPDSRPEEESYFSGRNVWAGGSFRHHFERGFAAETRVLYTELRPSDPVYSDRFVSTGEVFATSLPVGWGETSTGTSYELELVHDSTNTPGRGVEGGVRRAAFAYFHPTSGPGSDFVQYRIGLEQFIGGPSPAGRQLALKGFWSWMDPAGGDIPFQRLLVNEGSDSFRGYHDFRFRDRGIVGFTVEYRYPVWDFGQVGGGLGLDAYNFYDSGQVFGDHSSIRMESLTHSLGMGLRLAHAKDFMFLAEVAGSREDLIARFSVRQVFQNAKGGVYEARVPIPMR